MCDHDNETGYFLVLIADPIIYAAADPIIYAAKLLPGYRTGLSASWSPSAGRMRSLPKNYMKSEELFTNLCSQPCTTSQNEIGSRLEFETAGEKMQVTIGGAD